MSQIKVMDEVLANKIAAGEVVEKTMNVVKELVENSIDAKSTEIFISLIDSGVKEIKVEDNGIGMDKDDAVLAFSRHATSKLKDLDDLFNISSLGFRGEALPSIAAVSNVTLQTSKDDVGTKVCISGGKDIKIEKSDLSRGTTITVRNLFYNTPVRLKYLKNLYTELANTVEYIDKMALSYPDIKFRLTNNGNKLIETTGNGDLLKVIYDIYGADITKKMIPIEGENDDYYINGYISYPEVTKSNRNSITTLVNGRVIKNNDINKCIIDCYHTYIHKGRYPVIVLNISVDPILVDINIHPTKMDIKFSKFDTLEELIRNKITDRLKTLTLIPDTAVRNVSSFNEVYDQISHKEENTSKKNINKEIKYEEVVLDFDVNDTNVEYTDEVREEDKIEKKINKIKHMDVIGNIFMTYIICSNEDGMFLVDQHAAAERINYEKFLKELTEEKYNIINLLTPFRIDLKKDEAIRLKTRLDAVKELGIDIEEFGDLSFVVRSHPDWIKPSYAEKEITSILELISANKEFSKEKFIDTAVMSIACHNSVKAHEYISKEDMQWIVDNVGFCDNPFTCPHGRPTIITYTKTEIDKLFKRDYNE